MDHTKYIGNELELFANAVNWKSYIGSQLIDYIYGDVLEVGAGLGGTTPFLHNSEVRTWTCLEPDATLVDQLKEKGGTRIGSITPELLVGNLTDLEKNRCFDSIVYVDVLEHIEEDKNELRQAAAHFKANGTLVVLAPAHGILFSAFDSSIGHHRRYNRAALTRISPPGMRLEKSFYLDSVGLLLSLANRWVLRQKLPTKSQIRFWDKRIVPLSRIIDGLVLRSLGKSVVAVWRKPA
jgi:SAM-dependent methyltransferase